MELNTLRVSICIPAYNEEKNIKKLLDALCRQITDRIIINKIIVISSGSTDNTNKIVEEYCAKDARFSLIIEHARNGKASAINRFLQEVDDEVIIIESADTIPNVDMVEKLCTPFLTNKEIGMTGGAPIPVNDPNTFLGYIIHTWWWFHRNIPRFGEIIAFRNIIGELSPTTAVDEAYIQAKLVQKGYAIVHVDEAVVKNKGPETIADLIKQRRRIFNGHARLHNEEKVKINNMTSSSLKLLLFEYKMKNLQQLAWLVGGISIELYAQILGRYDAYLKKINPYIWDTAKTTKNVRR